jgi:hypothetical protein
MILALLLAAAAACSDYSAAIEVVYRHKGQPPTLNVSKETLTSLTNAAEKKALEVGYGLAYMTLGLYPKDDYYIAYFSPLPVEGRRQTGGDLVIVLDGDARVLCFFRGA